MDLPDLKSINDLLLHWLISVRHNIYIRHSFIGQMLTAHFICARTVIGAGTMVVRRPDMVLPLTGPTLK